MSYKVGFGGDPVQNWGGGMLSSFEAVPGSIHLDADANMEVRAGASGTAGKGERL